MVQDSYKHVEVRLNLTFLRESVTDNEIKKEFNGIDIVNCELTQNIVKKLEEK